MYIEVRNISKSYRKSKVVNEVSCSIHKGMYGILGRNGAGKTTFFRILVGLIKPSSGEILFKDETGVIIKRKKSGNLIGYLPQEFGMYPDFTVMDIMEEISILRNIHKSERKIEICNLLKKVNLFEEKKKKFGELSGGMKRRLGLAQAMIGTPKILIVDEPTAGVDPKERIYIRKILSDYAKTNIVLLSTHVIEDIEHTCQELLILEKGELLYTGDIEDLLLEASNHLEVKEFCDLDTFQEYVDENIIFTFRREQNKIVSVIPRKNADRIEFNISLEDAYMWKINKGGIL